jgi:hypothetical protein
VAHDQWRADLRIAAANDPTAIATILSAGLPEDGLQHAGDALLVAYTVSDPAVLAPIATQLVAALRVRGWDGDDELAAAIEHAAGIRPTTLTPLAVELDDLADALNQGGSEGYVDLQTGQVWTEALIDNSIDAFGEEFDFDNNTRWLIVWGQGPQERYGDMRTFIATVDDPDLAGRLERAIQGNNAFRKFWSVLDRYPDELTRWHRYSDDARIGRARAWLASQGYQPIRPTK